MLANKVRNKLRYLKNLTPIFPSTESPIGGLKRVDCFTTIGDEVMTSQFSWQLINPFADYNSSFNT
jgi:hypothetical protein